MSGRKYTEVELKNTVRNAIHCRMEMQDALARAESLATALTATARQTDALRGTAQHAREALDEVRQASDDLGLSFCEDRLMRLTMDEVVAKRRNIEGLRKKLQAIAAQCHAGQEAANVRAELLRIIGELESRRDILEPWLRDVWSDYESRARQTAVELDRRIASDGTAGPVTTSVAGLDAEFDRMLNDVRDRRALDGERRYVAEALRKVCVDELGFTSRQLVQRGPLDDLVIEIDTIAYGIIHFRLQLDGTIRSESNLIEASCPSNFAKIEEGLRSFGVISSFRYEADQRPVRIERGAQDLPESGVSEASSTGNTK
jgi:hypothetical protein